MDALRADITGGNAQPSKSSIRPISRSNGPRQPRRKSEDFSDLPFSIWPREPVSADLDTLFPTS